MRRLLLFLIASCAWAAPQQITITSANKAVTTIPGTSAYGSGTTYRFEWRYTVSSSVASGWSGLNQFAIQLGNYFGSGVTTVVREQVVSAGTTFQQRIDMWGTYVYCPVINMSQDTVVRFQPLYASATLQCETWNVDGSNYQINTGVAGTATMGINAYPQLQIGDATTSQGTLVFFRAYSTQVPANSKPPFGSSGGDLWDFEFNGNLNDSSSNLPAMTPTPSTGWPGYSTAPTYPPACLLPAQASFQSGVPTTYLTSANSFPLDGGNTLTTAWTIIAGNYTTVPPGTTTFAPGSSGLYPTSSAVNPTTTFLAAGSYTVQLTVTDGSAQSTPCSQKYGVVTTDALGRVQISNAVHKLILGPLMYTGLNPWPSYDIWAAKYALNIGAKMNNTGVANQAQLVDWWNTAAAGTISCTNGSATCTGTGTAFKSLFCAGGTTPNANSPNIVIWQPISNTFGFTGQTARIGYGIAGCPNDTTLTLSGTFTVQGYIQGGSNLQYAYVDGLTGTATGNIGGWISGTFPGNYYDNVLAFYALWWRTGIDDYLKLARTLADMWWTYPGINKGSIYDSNWGSRALQHRSMSLTGLYMRNADSPPYDYTPGLVQFATYLTTISGCNTPVGPTITGCSWDARDNGWPMYWVALDSLISTLNGNTSQATADNAALSRQFNNVWNPQVYAGNYFLQLSPTQDCSSWATSVTLGVTSGSSVISIAGGTFSNCGNYYNNSGPTSAVALALNSNGTTAPTSNASFDSHWYWVCVTNSTTIYFCNPTTGAAVNYNGSFGGSTGLGWSGGYVGFGIEPWMYGMLSSGFYYSSLALATADPTNAANAKAYLLGGYNYMVSTGVTASGSYPTSYASSFINCLGPPGVGGSVVDPGCGPGGNLNSNLSDQMNVYSYAMITNPVQAPAIRAFADRVFAGMAACTSADYLYAVAGGGICTAANGWTDDLVNPNVPVWKYYGQFWGTGQGSTYAAARILASPQSIMPSKSIGGSMSIAELLRFSHNGSDGRSHTREAQLAESLTEIGFRLPPSASARYRSHRRIELSIRF